MALGAGRPAAAMRKAPERSCITGTQYRGMPDQLGALRGGAQQHLQLNGSVLGVRGAHPNEAEQCATLNIIDCAACFILSSRKGTSRSRRFGPVANVSTFNILSIRKWRRAGTGDLRRSNRTRASWWRSPGLARGSCRSSDGCHRRRVGAWVCRSGQGTPPSRQTRRPTRRKLRSCADAKPMSADDARALITTYREPRRTSSRTS